MSAQEKASKKHDKVGKNKVLSKNRRMPEVLSREAADVYSGLLMKNVRMVKHRQRIISGRGDLTPAQVIFEIRKRFRKARESDEFINSKTTVGDRETKLLDAALSHLESGLRDKEDKEVPIRIARTYRLANMALRLPSEADLKVREDFSKKSGLNPMSDLSLDVYKIATIKDQTGLPYRIRDIAARSVKRGLEEVKGAVLTGKEVNVTEQMVARSIEFRQLLAERKRLSDDKKREIANQERKTTGVQKMLQNEEKETSKRTLFDILLGRKRKNRAKSAFKSLSIIQGYHSSTEQVEYEKIKLFYDNKLWQIDNKFDSLIKARVDEMRGKGQITRTDSLVFKNSVFDSIAPQSYYHVDNLRQIAEGQVVGFSAPDELGEEKIGTLKGFAQDALDLIWESG